MAANAVASRQQRRLGGQGVAALAFLAMHAALLAWGGWTHSPTYEETGHLPAGLYGWARGRFDADVADPPLIPLVAAMPVALASAEMDWYTPALDPRRREAFFFGDALLRANGERTFWFYTLARWACIPFSLLGGIVCLLWAKDMFGPSAGLLALGLWCFCPNILGHGHLMGADLGGAALGGTATYLFWRWLRLPTWRRAICVGFALGLAELANFTLIVLVGIWPVLWLLWVLRPRCQEHGRPRQRQLLQLVSIFLTALYVVNLGYGGEGSLQRLGDFRFVSKAFSGADTGTGPGGPMGNRFADHWLGKLPVPLPKAYLQGIDLRQLDCEHPSWSYLRGQWRQGGWWYYCLYALTIKVPIGTWILVLAACALAPFRRGYAVRWQDEVVLLIPVVAILLLVSSHTAFTRHMRFVLPIFPFLFVFASRVAQPVDRWHRRLALPLGAALVWVVSSSLWQYPHSLAYFNEWVGGPANGSAHLLGSNLDLGQDLFYLKRWAERYPEARPLALAYTSRVEPEDLGLPSLEPWRGPNAPAIYSDLRPMGPLPGWYAVGVNKIRNRSRDYDCFLHFQPVAKAGHSIYIYHISLDEANRVRRILGLPDVPGGQ